MLSVCREVCLYWFGNKHNHHHEFSEVLSVKCYRLLWGKKTGPSGMCRCYQKILYFFPTGNNQTNGFFWILMFRNIICRIIHGYCSILVFWIVKNLMTTRTKEKRLLKQVQLRCPTLYCNIRLYTYPNLGAEISGLNICPIAKDFNVLLCVCFKIILLLVPGNVTIWNCKDTLINGLQVN